MFCESGRPDADPLPQAAALEYEAPIAWTGRLRTAVSIGEIQTCRRAHARHTFNVVYCAAGAIPGSLATRFAAGWLLAFPPFVRARPFDGQWGGKQAPYNSGGAQALVCLLHTLRVWMRGAAGTSAFVSPTCCKVGRCVADWDLRTCCALHILPDGA
jgi:hypothetical protein